jgi:hypothetical protein
MEAGQQSEEGVSMGSAAVIFVLLVVIAIMAIGWNAEIKVRKHWSCAAEAEYKLKRIAETRNEELEAEIQRLRKIPLTQPQEKRDDSTIKAKSSADVRRLTEAAFGLQPEIGAQNEDE